MVDITAGTQFSLLGPLMVRCGGVEVPLPRGKQRVVLAALLLPANRIVPVDEIAEVLWGPQPPPSADVTIRNYVRRLRRALGDGSRISTMPRGYLMSVAASELDVSRFEVLARTAAATARDGKWDLAAVRAREALALWRGEPLADVEAETLKLREVPRLTEMRFQALETRIDADLHMGWHSALVAELRQLVDANPLREHLHALLMLSLYRCGRQADALAAYQWARKILIEEIGAEPGAELRELHQRMLAADPALAAPELAYSDASR
jgi:DNA-binding SARP family transcriptional activator